MICNDTRMTIERWCCWILTGSRHFFGAGSRTFKLCRPDFLFFSLNSIPNRVLRYLTTFVSAAKTWFQSWKNFHEMKRNPAHGQKSKCFSVVSSPQAHWTSTRPNCRASHYLGEYGSEASRIAYGQMGATLAGGISIDPIAKPKRGRTTTIESE